MSHLVLQWKKRSLTNETPNNLNILHSLSSFWDKKACLAYIQYIQLNTHLNFHYSIFIYIYELLD